MHCIDFVVHSIRSSNIDFILLRLTISRATGGELQAILDDERVLTEAQAQICMREILRALQYLHKKYIAHLDIKPQNILLCGDKVEGERAAYIHRKILQTNENQFFCLLHRRFKTL